MTLPPVKPVVVPSSFGFVEWAEKINGRAAMVSAACGQLCAVRDTACGLARPSPTCAVPRARHPQLGFILLLLIEGFSGTGILNLTGITTGKGLGFEF